GQGTNRPAPVQRRLRTGRLRRNLARPAPAGAVDSASRACIQGRLFHPDRHGGPRSEDAPISARLCQADRAVLVLFPGQGGCLPAELCFAAFLMFLQEGGWPLLSTLDLRLVPGLASFSPRRTGQS